MQRDSALLLQGLMTRRTLRGQRRRQGGLPALSHLPDRGNAVRARCLPAVAGGSPDQDLLRCRIEDASGATWLYLNGEADLSTAPVLRSCLARCLELGQAVVVDLTDIRYFDLAAVRVLESLREAFAARSLLLLLASPPPVVRRLFEIIEFDSIPLVGTRAEADELLARSRKRNT